MTSLVIVDIPAEIKHIALDPKEGKLEVYDTESFQVNRPFMHEAAYYHGLNTLYPWHPDEQKACITAIFNLWKEKRTEIEAAIQKKDKNVTVRTVKTGVRLFLECLYWTNDSPVHLQKGLIANELSVKPFNAEERLTFILSRPGGYHSYRQLDELFKELEKQFAIKMIKRK
ncbi:hypothetical protein SFC55_14165 [Niallia taxi]|uniref:YpoC family protein n=1 Tax=Niallia TaxID=2837506 RepID=UPI0039828626